MDAEGGKRVDEDDEVKGYPKGEDEFVLLEDDELDAVALESTRTIDVDMFAPAEDTSNGFGTTSRTTSLRMTKWERRPFGSSARRWPRQTRSNLASCDVPARACRNAGAARQGHCALDATL